jgi:hypothetical protein
MTAAIMGGAIHAAMPPFPQGVREHRGLAFVGTGILALGGYGWRCCICCKQNRAARLVS